MARFTLPIGLAGSSGPDARLLQLCAWFTALQMLQEEGSSPDNKMTDTEMDSLLQKKESVLKALFLHPAPVSRGGRKAKAGVARHLLTEALAGKPHIPWREQVSPSVAFSIDTLWEIAEAPA